MAHQSEPARFQALLQPTLQAYEKKAGVSLAQRPFANKLQSCRDSGTTLARYPFGISS